MCPVVLNLSLYLYSSKYTQLYSSWFNPCCNHTAVYQHSSLALAVPKYKCCVCPPLINLQKEHTLTWKLKKKEWLVNWLTRSWCPSAWLDDWLRKEVCAWFLIGPWGSSPLEKRVPLQWDESRCPLSTQLQSPSSSLLLCVSHTCTLKHPCILTAHLNSFLETRKQDAATQVKQQVPISQHWGLAWAFRLLQYGKTFLVLHFFNINYWNKLVY